MSWTDHLRVVSWNDVMSTNKYTKTKTFGCGFFVFKFNTIILVKIYCILQLTLQNYIHMIASLRTNGAHETCLKKKISTLGFCLSQICISICLSPPPPPPLISPYTRLESLQVVHSRFSKFTARFWKLYREHQNCMPEYKLSGLAHMYGMHTW